MSVEYLWDLNLLNIYKKKKNKKKNFLTKQREKVVIDKNLSPSLKEYFTFKEKEKTK